MSAVKYNSLKITNIPSITSDILVRSVNVLLNPSGNKRFGSSLDLASSDDTFIAGMPDYVSSSYDGRVRFYRKNASDEWSGYQTLQASDAQSSDLFGYSVSINASGNTAAIGAIGADPLLTSDAGAVYILTKSISDVWSEHQKLTASDRAASEDLGYDISINATGDLVAAGRPGYASGSDRGSVCIFMKNSSDVWSQRQNILTSDVSISGTRFGHSVVLNAVGDNMLVGAPFQSDTGANTGAVYFYTKDSSDIWSQRQKIQASDKQANDQFGWDITMNASGNVAMIGAPFEDTVASNAGAAYVFTKDSSDIWSERQKLQASDAVINMAFGTSVSINANGDVAMIGAPYGQSVSVPVGIVYLFRKNTSDIWHEVKQDILGSGENDDQYGMVCVISGNDCLAGAPGLGISDVGRIFSFVCKLGEPLSYYLFNDINVGGLFMNESDNRLMLKY